ncbi:MAG: orotidine-5'-phosphate decarboxylase [Candidatus Njordarchaeales archaeon]
MGKSLDMGGSRIILALDNPLIDCVALADKLRGRIAGIKIGLPYILTKGSAQTRDFLKNFAEDFFFIADTKMADVGHVMVMTLEKLNEMNFDAAIVHGFVGVKNALDVLVESSKELDMKLFMVAAMSHPGAEEMLNKSFKKLLDIAKDLDFYGIVLPATMPQYIRDARKILGNKEMVIISPGVGAQGANPGDALKAGADFEIIGRLIVNAQDPLKVVSHINEVHSEIINERMRDQY